MDPVLNRGVLFENQLMFEEAIADYRAVLKVSPNDPVGWNNLGNAQMGAGQFDEAISSLDRAVKLGGNRYAFAQANKAVALYAKGDDGEAEREMLSLLRRFPNFAEVRASLGALQWMKGEREKAEENWLRVNDGSYRSVDWLRNQRRWPKRLVDAAEAYLSLS
ncbi:MAG: tetratricopeptide repeat protein [bacterium]